ncbi:class I SAM-dependent DNA methyltransferase [Shimia biformata]|uniref:class I SAM-dependent DNA methyltransferase n=1 Tax=Shimia biformata TaxID=1294299 RepID=UPI00194FCC7E|nr:class I SAM-dependent methyltransferase [Shimia biformata]
MSDPDTLKFYDTQTDAYQKLAAGFENAALRDFAEQLPAGGHILDLGCGPGLDSALLVKAGFVVTAMDASAVMLRQAGMNPGVQTRLATFSDLDDVDVFDGIWAHFSLLHAPKTDLPAHLAAIHLALKPGGSLGLALKIGTGEARDKLGCFFAYYQEDELLALLESNGFTVINIARGSSVGMAGTNDPFLMVTAHA